ncbi:hypothetical protein QTL95_05140 [Rhizobium sp. S152]|nr:hypothetical protein [Rhizobium sp. S152]MDM9625266.1 hypothetical protein [Rhizobium sp. S152]
MRTFDVILHAVTGQFGIAGADRIDDCSMVRLNAFDILGGLGHKKITRKLNDESQVIRQALESLDKEGVVRRRRDCPMETNIFLCTIGHPSIYVAEFIGRMLDGCELDRRSRARCDEGDFALKRDTKLIELLNIGDAGDPAVVRHSCRLVAIDRRNDEASGAFSRLYNAFVTKPAERCAHNWSGNAELGADLRLGRQAGTCTPFPRIDFPHHVRIEDIAQSRPVSCTSSHV